ncbi:MAG: cation diffusion facilitator family transporter, partial [Candidatus Helarchaeota archaeon]
IMIMLVGWIGLKLAERKPTERFQYGFYKSESLATLGISVFIIIVTINLIWEGINRLIYVPQLSYPVEAIIILIISIIASGLISVFLLRVGRNINSQLLIINGKERREDVLSSLSVLAAIIMGYFGIPYVEGIITIAISILVLKVGIFSIKDSIFALMDIS